MPLVTIDTDPMPTLQERQSAFVASLIDRLKAEAVHRKQFIEQIEATVWDRGIQTENGVETQAGLTPEQKIEALNAVGAAVPLFTAGAADRSHLLQFAAGLTIADHPNRVNYDIAVSGNSIVITRKA